MLYLNFYLCDVLSSVRADAVVAVSKHISRHYPRVDFVIPNGFEIERFARQTVPRSPRPVILFVGQLKGRRRGCLLVDVFRQEVRPTVPEAELWMVCPERIEGSGIRWFGTMDNTLLARLYREAWVFCLPSSYEGFGRPYAEAMAAGTPVVATPNPGSREVLHDGQCGLLVADGELGNALVSLLIHPGRREEWGRKGAAQAAVYSWDSVTRQYERVYETLLARGRGREPEQLSASGATSPGTEHWRSTRRSGTRDGTGTRHAERLSPPYPRVTSSHSGRHGILVFQSMGVGDLIFALPALKVLKSAYPDETLALLTNARNESLASMVPDVDSVISYRDKSAGALLPLINRLRRQSFRVAVVLNPILKGSLAAWSSGAPIRVGYVRDFERKQSMRGLDRLLLTHRYLPREVRLHESERYLDLLRQFGLEVPPGIGLPRLDPGVEAREFGQRLAESMTNAHKGPLVVMNPGAAWDMRRWPADRFATIADWLIEAFDARVIIVGASSEQHVIEAVHGNLRHAATSRAVVTTLSQLVGVLSVCDLQVTNDTGPMHIGAALDIPMVALFGPGDPIKCRPLGSRAALLYHRVPCSPCQVQYTDQCRFSICMHQIGVDEVKHAVTGVLDQAARTSQETTRHVLDAAAARPRKVLYLQATSEIGGADLILLRAVQNLDRSRYAPHVVLPKDGPLVEAFQAAACRVHIVAAMRKLTSRRGLAYLGSYLAGYRGAVRQLVRLIRREQIDLVHTNTIHNLYGFAAARAARRPHVWHVREIVVGQRSLRALETWLARRYSDRIVVMSDAISEAFRSKSGKLPGHLAKLHDGVDLDQFHPEVSGKSVRGDLKIEDGTPLVGIVARLDPWKGHGVFLETAKRVHGERPDVKFLVCGGEIEGHEGYEADLQQNAASLGLRDVVFFAGWRYGHRDIPQVYGALDVFVHCPVQPEPAGLTYVEAMASGVPIVASNEGGPAELCVDGVTALLVPPRSPDQTAAAVLTLLGDSERRCAMGRAGRQRAEQLFDNRRCVAALESLYDEVLATA